MTVFTNVENSHILQLALMLLVLYSYIPSMLTLSTFSTTNLFSSFLDLDLIILCISFSVGFPISGVR